MKNFLLFVLTFFISVGFSQPITFTNGTPTSVTNGLALTSNGFTGVGSHAIDITNTTTTQIDLLSMKFRLFVTPGFVGNANYTVNLYSIAPGDPVTYANMTLLSSTTTTTTLNVPVIENLFGLEIKEVIAAISLVVPANTPRFIIEFLSNDDTYTSYVAGNDANPTTYWSSTFFGFPDLIPVLELTGDMTGIFFEVSGLTVQLTPTLGQWGLILLFLSFLLISSVIISYRRLSVEGAHGLSVNLDIYTLLYQQVKTNLSFLIQSTLIILFGITIIFAGSFYLMDYPLEIWDVPFSLLSSVILGLTFLQYKKSF